MCRLWEDVSKVGEPGSGHHITVLGSQGQGWGALWFRGMGLNHGCFNLWLHCCSWKRMYWDNGARDEGLGSFLVVRTSLASSKRCRLCVGGATSVWG